MSGLRGLSAPLPHDWLVPDWPAPPQVRAVCTTRAGGVSAGAYRSLNLGLHVGDEQAAVLANRARLHQAIGARPVFLQQTHGTDCHVLAADTRDGDAADACSTQQPGVACTIMVADCLPVLLCDAAGRQVAAAHAGWRGLAAGVLPSVLQSFKPAGHAKATVEASDLIAWLGPCIGPLAFEVGADVVQAFAARGVAAQALFRPTGPGKWLADLAGLARLELQSLGIAHIHGNNGSAPWCTVRNGSRFFSHRRDGRVLGASGRFAACVWRDGA